MELWDVKLGCWLSVAIFNFNQCTKCVLKMMSWLIVYKNRTGVHVPRGHPMLGITTLSKRIRVQLCLQRSPSCD